jgi:hypothetical protein
VYGGCRGFERAVVTNQIRGCAGLVASVCAVTDLVAPLHESDLTVGLPEAVDQVPMARCRLANGEYGVPVDQRVLLSREQPALQYQHTNEPRVLNNSGETFEPNGHAAQRHLPRAW